VQAYSVLCTLKIAAAFILKPIRLVPIVGRNLIVRRAEFLLNHSEPCRYIGPGVAIFNDPEIIIGTARPVLRDALKLIEL
jgi:hypothetical protein